MPRTVYHDTKVASALLVGILIALTAIIGGTGEKGISGDVLESSLDVTDQQERLNPFFIRGYDATTSITAEFVLVISDGTMMPYPGALFDWKTHEGVTVLRKYEQFTYAGSNTLIATSTVHVNLSTFPPETRPYRVTAGAGDHLDTEHFHVCGRFEAPVILEDFSSRPVGSVPDNWIVEEPGYSESAQWVEELTFEGRNKALRITSYIDQPARLVRPVNLSSEHLHISFKARVKEILKSNQSVPLAFSFGLDSGSNIPLVELGGSDRMEELYLGVPYNQDSWLRMDLYMDLDEDGSSSSLYIDDTRIGSRALPGMMPEEIESFYVELTGGGHYVAHIDDLSVEPFALGSGPSGRPVKTTFNVSTTTGQWFDPSSFEVSYVAEITPCAIDNPYLCSGLDVEIWNSTHYLGDVGRTEWNYSACGSPCKVTVHSRTWHIHPGLIERADDFDGLYSIVFVPRDESLSMLAGNLSFQVDDPIEAYLSRFLMGPALSPAVIGTPSNISLNVEFDPEGRSRDQNHTYDNKWVHVSWFYPDGESIRNETHLMSIDEDFPSTNPWIFSAIKLRDGYPDGTYTCLVTAVCDSGYTVTERRQFRIPDATMLGALLLLISGWRLAPRLRKHSSGDAISQSDDASAP
jgi:hypothetical protein